MQDFSPINTNGWRHLMAEKDRMSSLRVVDLIRDEPRRVEKYSLSHAGIHLDFSKNLVNDRIARALLQLAAESPLAKHREAMFRGQNINLTEDRPVLHTALRALPATLEKDGIGHLSAGIAAQKARIKVISEQIRSGNWLGVTGEPITDVVNLGIGGSDLGPKMVCEALKEFAHPEVRCHFVSNVDGEVIRSTLKTLQPATTLVIVASKTFTTQETLLNARTAASWFQQALGLENPFASPHFIGVTASPENAVKEGLAQDNILEFWGWVGGRYSLWSSIGLAIAISTGYDTFEALLSGARAMDDHFRYQPFRRNMPVILALLGFWYGNVLGAESHAVIPYCERLGQLPFYLQQLDMESNGKSVSLDHKKIGYRTGPIIWGLTGTNGQHSFFQLLHQGTHLVPVDFIGVLRDPMSSPEHHRVLLANMLAQSSALMLGKQAPDLPAYRQYPGNRPSNVMLLDRLDAKTLGALIALYEHKVFVQGVLWHVNSFDQWGVELGKVLASSLLDADSDKSALDASTRALLTRVDATSREE
jgi:glucose-6-phosphate isomerase